MLFYHGNILLYEEIEDQFVHLCYLFIMFEIGNNSFKPMHLLSPTQVPLLPLQHSIQLINYFEMHF